MSMADRDYCHTTISSPDKPEILGDLMWWTYTYIHIKFQYYFDLAISPIWPLYCLGSAIFFSLVHSTTYTWRLLFCCHMQCCIYNFIHGVVFCICIRVSSGCWKWCCRWVIMVGIRHTILIHLLYYWVKIYIAVCC